MENNNNKISYNIEDIQNICMIDGKLEFELKPKNKTIIVEEKKPKKPCDKIVVHQKRKDLVEKWYKNFDNLKRTIIGQEINEKDLQNQVQLQVQRINKLIGNQVPDSYLEELFEYGVIANMSILANKLKFPHEFRDKMEAYMKATINEIKNMGDEEFEIIMGETRKFVEDYFYYAFILSTKRPHLQFDEKVKKDYEAILEANRNLRDYHRFEKNSVENITQSWEKSMSTIGTSIDYF